MLKEHFYEPEEFWGDWMPSIARNDKAYNDQSYWRGRIWVPMNLLVYLGFGKHGLAAAGKDLAEKSQAIFLRSGWSMDMSTRIIVPIPEKVVMYQTVINSIIGEDFYP